MIPLTGPQCDLLPMHFFVDPGCNVDWNNLPEDNCTMMGVIRAVQDYLEVNSLMSCTLLCYVCASLFVEQIKHWVENRDCGCGRLKAANAF